MAEITDRDREMAISWTTKWLGDGFTVAEPHSADVIDLMRAFALAREEGRRDGIRIEHVERPGFVVDNVPQGIQPITSAMVNDRDLSRARTLLDQMCIAWNEQDDDCVIVATEFAAVREETKQEPRSITDAMVEAVYNSYYDRVDLLGLHMFDRDDARAALEAAERAR